MQMAGGQAPREPLRVWVEVLEVRWVLILARSRMVIPRRLGRTVWSWTRWRTRLGLSSMTSSIYLDNLFRPFLWFLFSHFSHFCNACLLLYSAFLYSPVPPSLSHSDVGYVLPPLPPPPISCVPSAESVLCSLTDDL